MELHDFDSANFITQIIAFSTCLFVVSAFIIFMFKEFKTSIYTEKLLIFKGIALILTLLRSVLLTYFIQIITFNFMVYDDETSAIKFIQVFLVCATSTLLAIIVYYSSQLFILNVPNKFLPWAESSN